QDKFHLYPADAYRTRPSIQCTSRVKAVVSCGVKTERESSQPTRTAVSIGGHSMIRNTAVIIALSLSPLAQAVDLSVTFTNNQPPGGFSTSPVWMAVHNGQFDMFNPGSAASSGLESLAELGLGAGLTTSLDALGTASTLNGPGPLPQFTPGQSASTTV